MNCELRIANVGTRRAASTAHCSRGPRVRGMACIVATKRVSATRFGAEQTKKVKTEKFWMMSLAVNEKVYIFAA